MQEVSKVIRNRRTSKVLSNGCQPIVIDSESDRSMRAAVDAAIIDAGFAPFHYARNQEVAEPWRFHVLWHEDCRYLSCQLPQWFPDIKPNNKLPAMLAACGCLLLVTWLPQFSGSEDDKQIRIDEEHLAATAAAVQNLLLSLTAAGFQTYWSSGGQLRTTEAFHRLGIPAGERLLAGVFVNDPNLNSDVEVITGKLHAARGGVNSWFREIQLDRD